jgi:hypothetical protein
MQALPVGNATRLQGRGIALTAPTDQQALLYSALTGLYTPGTVSGGSGAVASVFGRTGVVVPQTGDYTAAQVTNAVSTGGSYADPAWITNLAGSKLTGTVVATNGVVTTGSYTNPTWITSLAGTKVIGSIGGTAGGGPGGVNTLLPSQSAQAGRFLSTDGTNVSWDVPGGGAGGTGSVTTVSVVTANGVSASVNNPTTTPALTFTLGVITPVTVNGLTLTAGATGFTVAGGGTSKTLTVPLDATVSGSNTGDQVNIVGNAGTVTNGVVTTGSYADPTWITALAGSKLTGTVVATNGVVTTGSYANPAWITSLAGSKVAVFGASGGSHAAGAVPDPGSSAGSTRYLREDATWVVPSGGGGAVTSVFGRTGIVVAATDDYTAAQITNAVSTAGSYADPTWITSLAGSKVAVFGASGGSHGPGAVPDPGSSTGSTRFLRENATWGVPTVSGSSPVVGGSVTGGTPGSVLQVDGSGNLAEFPLAQGVINALNPGNGLTPALGADPIAFTVPDHAATTTSCLGASSLSAVDGAYVGRSLYFGQLGLTPGGGATPVITAYVGSTRRLTWSPALPTAPAFGAGGFLVNDDAAAIQAISDAYPGHTIYLPTTANPPTVGGVLQPSYWLHATPAGNPDGVAIYLRHTGTKLVGDGFATLLKCGPRVTGVWSASYGQEVSDFAIYGSAPWTGATAGGGEQAVVPVGQYPGLTRLAGGDDSDGLRVSNLNSKFSRLILEGHGRDGINCSAHDQNLPGSGGAEDCTFDTIFTQNNRRHGVRVEGGDSNVNTWINVSCNVNGGWGFQILSFLGQSLYGAQVNQNGWDSSPYVGDGVQALTAITRDSGGTVTATFAAPHGLVVGNGLELRYCPDSTFLGRWPIATVPSSTTVTWQQVGRSAATPTVRAPVTTLSSVNGPTRVPVASTTGIAVGMHVLGPYAPYLGPGREDVIVDAVDVAGGAVTLSTASVNGGNYNITYCDAAAVRNILSASRAILSATRVVTPPTVTPTVTTTLGSPTVAVSSTAGIVVGMTIRSEYLDSAGILHPFFSQETTVTSIGSGSITVSRPAIYARSGNPSTIGYDYWQNSGTCLTILVFNGAYTADGTNPLVVGHGLTVYNTGDLTFDGTFICITVDTDGSGNTRVTYPQQGSSAATLGAAGSARLAVPEDAWAAAGMTGGGYYSGNVTASTSPNVWMNCYGEGNQPWRLGDADLVFQPIGGNKIYGGDVHLAQIGGLGAPGGTRGQSIQATRDGDEVVYRRIGVTTAGAYTELYQDPTRTPFDPAATIWGWKTSPSAVGLYHGDPASASALFQATSTGVALAGVPTAPTATTGTNTTQLATCAFVLANAGGGGGSPGGSSGQLQYNSSSSFGGTAAGAYAGSGDLFTFTALAATDTPLVIKGHSGQSASLVEVRNSANTALFEVSPDGSITTNPGTAQSVRVGPLPGDPSYGGVWVGPSSPGSSNFALLAQTGATLFNGTTGLSFRAGNLAAMFVDANGGTPRTIFSYLPDATFGDTSAVVSVVTADASLKGMVVRGRASQTANLLEFQSSTPTTLSAIRSDGSWQPPHLADSAAANDSLYYSTTQSKLCYKDSGGTSNPLY